MKIRQAEIFFVLAKSDPSRRTVEESVRICIYGAGASGGHLAVRLAIAGHQVSVVARGANLDAIRHDGLRLLRGEQILRAQVAASADPAALGEHDLVLVTVKATALEAVARGIAPLVGTTTRVVFAQNGMPWWYPLGLEAGACPLPAIPVFDLASRFLPLLAPSQVFGGILYTANSLVSPGVVRNNSPQHNGLEVGAAVCEGAAQVDGLRDVLESAGIASPRVDDIRTAVWAKLVGNACSSSIAVITGNPSAISVDATLRAVFERSIAEAMAVAAAHGHPLAGRLDLSRWAAHRAAHRPSLLQDLESGRPMEVAEMLLSPVAFARAAGVDTPTLDALASLAARIAIDRGLYAPPGA